MNKVLIVGVTSGIGYALAMKYLTEGHIVIGCGRNEKILKEMNKHNNNFFFEVLDIRRQDDVEQKLSQAVLKAGGMDICIISAGISQKNKNLDWDIEKNIISTNVTAFSEVAVWAARFFLEQKSGHLVGISSIAKYFGNPNPAYNASKAFEAIYLDGLRLRLEPKGIFVTTVLPGFIKTPMIKDQPKVFWAANVTKAAEQIISGIRKKKRYLFVTKRWRLFSFILPPLPFSLLRKIL